MNLAEEYLQRILKALTYIENHIDEEIEMGQLAKVACYSSFHFHRIFQTIVGETAGQYIKRLRLEKAAGKLYHSDRTVTEIALNANYSTPSAFTKAFKQFMGKSPIDYRAFQMLGNEIITKQLKELPMIKPDKIEKISDLNVLFVRRVGSYTTTPAEAWKVMDAFIHSEKLENQRQFGIYHDDPAVTSEDKLRSDACIEAPASVKGKGEIGKTTLKGGKYAQFTHVGSYESIKDTFNSIFLKWLSQSGEQFDESRSVFCEYLKREFVKTDPSQLITKIYIPLN